MPATRAYVGRLGERTVARTAAEPGLSNAGATMHCGDAPVSARRARVLTADDDIDTADTTADLLRLDGHDVRAVYDGQQAVDVARSFGRMSSSWTSTCLG